MAFRSLLFVPATRPERFGKALAASADAVCIDLEDAVAPADKAAARETLRGFFSDGVAAAESPAVGLRINALNTAEGQDDARMIAALPKPVDFIIVPKTESAEALAGLRAVLGDASPPIWPLIETAEGLYKAWDICAASGVAGVMFGGVDYSADIGSDMGWDALCYARGALIAAAARAGIESLDVPYVDVRDIDGLRSSTKRVKSMGFTGRACIHPDQVAVVNEAFSPTPAEIEQLRRVLEAFEAANGGAALLDGKLIERPVIRAAQRALSRVKGN